MRIYLLDHSGSMSEPFHGNVEFSGRARETEAAVKLEAAKTEVLRSIAGLASETRIALFEFTSAASCIYEGSSGDQPVIKRAIEAVEAGGATNIAAALAKASEYLEQQGEAPLAQVLVITDGLSDPDQARAAAQKLVATRIVIVNVILIDPTEQGEKVARAIAVNGEVFAVTSAGELGEKVDEIAREQEKAEREVSTALAEYQKEASAVINQVATPERLAFTAVYPAAVSPDAWYSLLVYLHQVGLQAKVAEIAQNRAGQLGFKALSAGGEAARPIRRGTWLKLIPRAEGITFNPLSQEVAWFEDIQESPFRFIADQGVVDRPLVGVVEVYCGPVLIALIPFPIVVGAAGSVRPEPATSTARIFDKIFASYSHKDQDIVDACAAVYKALGIYVYIDKESLRAGQYWASMLHTLISQSDLFQLYWSESSKNSPFVEDEWREALTLVGQKPTGFIRPLCWEERPPDLPRELSHIQYGTLDLAAVGLRQEQPASAARTAAPAAVIAPSLPVAVIPVLPGTAPETQKAVREDTAFAVSFLEETTCLRYYPVPTLLVDDHMVKSVRSLQTTDLQPEPDQASKLLAFSDLLHSIELTFHMENWRPSSLERDRWPIVFGRGTVVSSEQFDVLRGLCEGGLQPSVQQYVSPAWLKARAELVGNIPGVTQHLSFSAFVVAAFESLVNAAQPKGRTRGVHGAWYFFGQEPDQEAALKSLIARAGVPAPPDAQSISLENVRFDDLLAALRFCRDELSKSLSSYDNFDPGLPVDPNPQAEELAAMAELVDPLVRELVSYNSPFAGIHTWLSDVVNPSWRSYRDSLANAGFSNFGPQTGYLEFISTCLDTVHALLKQGLANLGDFHANSGYAIKPTTWETLKREIPDLQVDGKIAQREFAEQQEVFLEGAFSEFVRMYGKAKDRLLAGLARFRDNQSPLALVFTVEAPTYGVYAPSTAGAADERLKMWAFERGIPTELTFPQSPRVLFCLSARERLEEETREALADRQAAQQMAREFQRSVLIHEHFHAILETGLDEQRSAANSVTFQEAWHRASPLNESLAAWMQLHEARANQARAGMVWTYIRAGEFPHWPYRGAEKIEALFQQQGIEAVRNLIRSLRRDPESAQAQFDAMAWS